MLHPAKLLALLKQINIVFKKTSMVKKSTHRKGAAIAAPKNIFVSIV